MVWPFTPSRGDSDPKSQRDPLRDLDPSLREFLERESPVKYTPPASAPSTAAANSSPPLSTPSTASTATAAASSSSQSSPSPSSAQDTSSSTSSSPTPAAANVPTLYKDGRYAHLWSTYRPLSDIEATNTSPQDKLADILAGYRDRKANIGRAALENCALEQFQLNDCYRNGAMRERFLNCRNDMHRLDRCYNMNQRLLRALGYQSAYDRGPAVEEQIQMHADKLYQSMLAAEEKEVAETESRSQKANAGTAGKEDGSVAAEARTRRGFDASLDPALLGQIETLRPAVRDKFRDRLDKMAPDERPLEERALAMELMAGKQVVQTVDKLRDQGAEQRDDRLKKGQGTVQDRLARLLGW